MNFKNLIYSIACICFSIIIGAAIYEHVAVWPRAFSAPPASLTMFQGQFGLNAAPFWKAIHPLTLLLFITCLILFRKSSRRKTLLTVFISYVIILIATFTYFIPQLMAVTQAPFSEVADAALIKKASTWETLSIIRMIVLIVLGGVLLMGLTKPVNQHN